MLFQVSGLHLCLLTFAGSWLSWNKHFRWATNIHYIKSIWILFKCHDVMNLAANLSLYGLFFNSAHIGKNEVSIDVAGLKLVV